MEILSAGTSDIKLLEKTIEKCLFDYSIIKYKELLPSTGDGSTTKYLFEEFTKSKYAKGCREDSMKKYLNSIKKLYVFVGKELNLTTREDLRNYLAFYKMGGENHQHNFEPISDSSVKSRYRDLSSFYTWLYNNKYIAENPVIGIEVPKSTIKPKKVITTQTMEQMIISCEKYYTNDLKLLRNTAMITLLIETGVRNNELCNIKIEDVDFNLNRIIIRDGKGGKSRRVYFGNRTKERLVAYLNLRTYSENDYLFTHYYDNSKFRPCGVQNVVKQVESIANLPRLYPHLFRASFATRMIDMGVSPMIVKELMGHSNLETLNSYVQMTDEMITNAIRIAFD